MLTLAPKPVAETSDFIATLRSLRSTTVQPQGEGDRHARSSSRPATACAPGRRWSRSTPAASRRRCAARRPTRPAPRRTSNTGARRSSASSRCSVPARSARPSSIRRRIRCAPPRRGSARSTAQVREGRVQLDYYRVEATQAGIVGEIPVRVGDRVTTSTVITTIDDNSGARALHPGAGRPRARAARRPAGPDPRRQGRGHRPPPRSPSSRRASTTRRRRCWPRRRSRRCRHRSGVQQFVRSRIVWKTAEGLTIPVTAVTRISGQYFCFVAEAGPAGRAGRAAEAAAGRRADRQRLRGH